MQQPLLPVEVQPRQKPSRCNNFFVALFENEKYEAISLISITFVLGIVLGLALPADSNIDNPSIARLSAVLGWIYFVAWIISFLPQLTLNFMRQSVEGMSFNSVFLGTLGFVCYAAYTLPLYYSPLLQQEYENDFGSAAVVQSADVFFCIYAVALECVAIYQIIRYHRAGQSISPWTWVILGLSFLYFAIVVGLGGGKVGQVHDWVQCIIFISYVKVAITFIRYIPQIHLNFMRKSTLGFNTTSVLLDLIGGSFSLAQLFIDCAAQGNWSGLSGDPVKLALSLLTLVYDGIYLFQRYVLYGNVPPQPLHNGRVTWLLLKSVEATS